MNIEDSKSKVIYRNEYNGNVFYKIGLYHKKNDGTYENGYMSCRFPKEANIPDKTRIMIVKGWLDFYVKDKVTYPYIFINQYEIVENATQTETQNVMQEENVNMELSDSDLPF